MLTLDSPAYVSAIPEEVTRSDLPYMNKIYQQVRVDANTISFTDQMGEPHLVNISDVNRQIWKDRLMQDVDAFTKLGVRERQDRIEQQ
jgi:hypothetical protein